MKTATPLTQIFSAVAPTPRATAGHRPEQSELREHRETAEFLMRLV